MDRKWWKEGVVYQIYPRSFYDSNGDGIGDIRGIIEKLDYLKGLGVDIIWLSPVYKSPNDDNGYDISDYYDIMDEFGTMDDMNELISEAHIRDLRIIMDLVVNHTSDEHSWFVESRKSKDNPYRDYYYWREGENLTPPNNWGSYFGGSAWEFDEKTDEYYLHLFSKKQPDLNWENPEVRKKIYEMMNWWLDKGIDGFRMDVINMISKTPGLPDGKADPGEYSMTGEHWLNGPRVHEYLKEMNKVVLSKYDIMTVGETPGTTPDEALKYVGFNRNELNMLIHFELMDVDRGETKWDFKEWSLHDIKKIFNKWNSILEGRGWNSNYLSNHDQPRMVSRFADDKKYRIESAKMLATLLHTMPGTPFIYQGEEIGMTNVYFENIQKYRDIETINFYNEQLAMGKDKSDILNKINMMSRDNARTPMQWDKSKNAGFTEGSPWIDLNPDYEMINVREAVANKNSVYWYYHSLLKLRKKHRDLFVYGRYTPIPDEDEDIFAYLRAIDKRQLLVILNFYDGEPVFKLPERFEYKDSCLLLSNYNGDENLKDEIELNPYEARIYIME